MRLRSAVALGVVLAPRLFAQAALLRAVHGDTLISTADPVASFVFATAFHFAGGQTIDILRVAGADQYFFIDAAADRSIRRFYWMQFEHYYPSNTNTYDYSGITQTPVQIGRLAFMGDVRVSPRYFTMDDRPGSDSKAAENFLHAQGFKLAGTFVTVRLFHLPDATRRRELMVIYGEILPSGGSDDRVKSEIVAHAIANITVP